MENSLNPSSLKNSHVFLKNLRVIPGDLFLEFLIRMRKHLNSLLIFQG